MTEADDGDMHGEIPLLLRESVQSDALSSILHVDGVCETAGVVQVADDQAARAGAISFELHSIEKKTICDAAAGETQRALRRQAHWLRTPYRGR